MLFCEAAVQINVTRTVEQSITLYTNSNYEIQQPQDKQRLHDGRSCCETQASPVQVVSGGFSGAPARCCGVLRQFSEL